ncbi:bifunctional folylpolyglutamate synthase/dihydrofolate synthase [Capsulimonas corticalis]|uniref:tetrahydrofolate synthase n=1 Tax=Capsulimonas corticalis TaxID=2219043 RepID=A0A402D281_9BACT|nr:folylpolyglutamate synthase/dihydrofolate synthase family protein [Capsulimonas corticalis]BDI30185.1 bifunctional folylpolyglutamate synthase/dihydrofolate synthase [Capsulimonas corticalis]
MNFNDALLYMQGRLRLGVKLGNERFLALLERAGSPQEQLAVVHIAGTKGKGSTASFVSSILTAAGYRVGSYMSPFVYDVRERIQINGVMIPQDDFARWVGVLKPHIEAIEATELGATTEFELKTAVGLCYFAEQKVDYAVLEVGLGGRLDATNVIPHPLVTAITNIGYDHVELLGDTLAKIAREKAGIVKPGVPCVTGVPIDGEADEAIAEICRAQGAPLHHVVAGDGEFSYVADDETLLSFHTPRRRLTDVRLKMRGAFQHANAAVAVAALDAIVDERRPVLPDDRVKWGLENAFAPGRLQQIADRPAIVVDVAHNELSAQALADALRADYGAGKRRLILIAGLSKNHAPDTFLKPLAALHPAIFLATQPAFHPREATEVAEAAAALGMPDVRIVPDVPDAARAALAEAAPGDLICVTGSFYTVGDLPPQLWRDLLAERK